MNYINQEGHIKKNMHIVGRQIESNKTESKVM